jgi:hypothetical protein
LSDAQQLEELLEIRPELELLGSRVVSVTMPIQRSLRM